MIARMQINIVGSINTLMFYFKFHGDYCPIPVLIYDHKKEIRMFESAFQQFQAVLSVLTDTEFTVTNIYNCGVCSDYAPVVMENFYINQDDIENHILK